MVALLISAGQATPSLQAGSRKQKAPCKKIKEAVLANRTLEQIMADFQVDEQQVMKCMQKKGKRRKEKTSKAPKSTHSGSTAAHQPSSKQSHPAP